MSTALRKTEAAIIGIGAHGIAGMEYVSDPVEWGMPIWQTSPKPTFTFLTAQSAHVPDYTSINLAIQAMKTELATQRSMIEQILAHVSSSELGLIIEMEEVDNTVARERILKLFNDHAGTLFYDEIAEKLRLPLRQTVEICNQLEQEGLIGEPATK